MRIGAVAKRAGCAVSSVRFYEGEGLMPRASRAEGNHRLYAEADVDRLKFILRARRFGMSMAQVRALLKASTDTEAGCARASSLIEARLGEIRAQRKELRELEGALLEMAERCQTVCAPGGKGCCTIFEDLRGDVLSPSTSLTAAPAARGAAPAAATARGSARPRSR